VTDLSEHRIFARIDIDELTAPFAEFYSEEELDARGGVGDELYYDEDADTFSYATNSGCAPLKTVPNPVPGDPLKGAPIVSAQADAEWEG
jgi:hypothetical protein